MGTTGTLDLPLQIQHEPGLNSQTLSNHKDSSQNEIEDEIARLRRENEALKQSLIQ